MSAGRLGLPPRWRAAFDAGEGCCRSVSCLCRAAGAALLAERPPAQPPRPAERRGWVWTFPFASPKRFSAWAPAVACLEPADSSRVRSYEGRGSGAVCGCWARGEGAWGCAWGHGSVPGVWGQGTLFLNPSKGSSDSPLGAGEGAVTCPLEMFYGCLRLFGVFVLQSSR